MFGYINANKSTMTNEEIDIYRSYYCGLCQQLKKEGGKRCQLLLNYDCTFLSLLLAGLYEVEGESSTFTCGLHPTKKKTAFYSEATEYAAAMDIILSYHNLLDDFKDTKNPGKQALAKYIEPTYKRMANKYPRQAHAVEELMRLTAEAEKRKETNVDILSGYTGEMLAELFDWKQDLWSNELRNMGYYMGKFIYMMDAYDDLPSDIKKRQFNPLIDVKEKCPDGYETYCESALSALMAECAKSFERLPILMNANVIRNIIYSGVWTKYEYIQLKRNQKSKAEETSAN
ncbi:MAG: DUF5685 family protein [Lachnospiraceae bacterium]|nr:DUF5685 family protein [Lachnospiraceae bacterium]